MLSWWSEITDQSKEHGGTAGSSSTLTMVIGTTNVMADQGPSVSAETECKTVCAHNSIVIGAHVDS